ncbi:hypothetical protein Taro_055426 [Colocasia esculenta]|uniref:Uncharacterized protein n=1 Tax=Colocasia esculenta TaxID=4460 RepID=A0A843XU62_COLES|nr:hypothetical protein [Colocasia esculenta]
MGIHMGLLHSMSVLMAACGRRVTRASRRLRSSGRLQSLDRAKIAPSWAPYLSRRISMIPLRGGRKRKEDRGEHKGRRGRKRTGSEEEDSSSSSEGESSEEVEEEEGGVWRRTILMGEKCQPLDFAGVIYYDSKGRRLPGPPRSPLRSPLPSFSSPAAVPSDKD